jgi:hypothetical protein
MPDDPNDPNVFGFRQPGWNPGPQYLRPGSQGVPRRHPGFLWYPGGAEGVPVTPVREVNRYPLTTTIALTLAAAAVPAAPQLTQSDKFRILLAIGNSAASAGTVLVGFGQVPTAATAVFTIVAGGVVYLDYVVPQDDVYLFSTAGANCVILYANSQL